MHCVAGLGMVRVFLLTCALLIVPPAVGMTTIVMVAVAPLARLPRLQVTTPPAWLQPDEAET